MYAKVAAHSGLDIVFSKEGTKVKNKAGEDTYRPAAYEWQKNLITVNPESKKGAESILIHELDHAVRNYFSKDGQRMSKVFGRALAETDKTTQEEILKNSEEVAKPGQLEKVFKDEVNAYFAERMLTNRQTLERIVKAEPGIKDRILSFFKGASADYADVPKLSGSAKWYYKKFKKMFDDFSARNSEALANEKSLTNINQGNMSVSDRQYAIVALENGNTYVTATRKVIKGNTKQEQRKEITQFFNVLLENKSSLDIHTVEGDILTITKAETAYKARDDYKTVGGKAVPMTEDEFKVKLNAEAHIDELAEISTSSNHKFVDTKNHSFAKDGFTYRTAYFEDFDGQYYKITLSVGHNGNIATIYSVGKITKSVPSSAKIIAVVGSKALDETLSSSIISQPEEKSNGFDKNSLENSSDKQFALPIDEDGIPASVVLSWFENKPKSDEKIDL